MPNPLEFFGYVYCFTTFLAGPAFEYNDYSSVVDETAYFNKSKGSSKRPSSILGALWRLLQVRPQDGGMIDSPPWVCLCLTD